jgi:hypothetical protein
MNTQEQAEIAQASVPSESKLLTLDTPIKRGDTAFSQVTIRKPFGPALRGLSIMRLLNEADHDAFAVLIPRITSPQISKADIESGALELPDLIRMIAEITYFFLPKAERERIDSQTE